MCSRSAGEVRRFQPDDLDQITPIRREAFGRETDPAVWLRDGWALDDSGTVLACALVEHASQYFRGRAVPCALVRSVAVASHARGTGRGTHLLEGILRAQREAGFLISALYPTSLAIYRRVGYEVAGTRTRYRQPLDTLPSPGELTVEPFGVEHLDALKGCYLRYARISNGLLDRPARWWDHIERALAQGHLQGCLVRSAGSVSGYMLYSQSRRDSPPVGFSRSPFDPLGLSFSLECEDLVWTDLESARALLAFASGFRGIGTDLLWFGPFPEPIALLQELQDARRVEWTELWMARLLDVSGSLQARGYPTSLSGCVELQVTDHTLKANAGAVRLTLAGGTATVEPIPQARLQLSVGTLACLYTGCLPARHAAAAGLLKNGTEGEIDFLDTAFAGPSPWLMDIF